MRRRAKVVNYRRSGYGWLDDGVFIHIQDVRTPELALAELLERVIALA